MDSMMEDQPSVCTLHPGVAVTGFCPACLRDRLAGLHPPPPASADLRRCKSFSYYVRSTSSSSHLQEQPHRRSCDARQPPPVSLPDPDETIGRPMKEHISQESSSSTTKAAGALGSLGKRWQEWRRKTKLKKQQHEFTAAATTTRPPPPKPSFDALGRRSCDAFSTRSMLLGVDEPRASCDGGHMPPQMVFVPRSDDQIPVEDEEAYEPEAVPGGTAQTRDYYLDSSSSSRRRRSVDRKSFSSDAGELPRMIAVAAGAAANARVSPAVVGSEFYHHQQAQQQLSHHYQHHQPSFVEPPFFGREEATKQSKHKSNGIKGWRIWGLLHKKSSSSNNISAFGSGEVRAAAAAPELRERGYDGQVLRCNSSVSARSSFSGSGSSFNGGLGRMRRADQVLLERNFSARYSSSSCRMSSSTHTCFHRQFHKDNNSNPNSIANNYGGGGARPPRSSASSSLPSCSLGLSYY